MPPLPEAIILVLAPLAPRLSNRLWGHAHIFLLVAIRAPGARTVTTALQALGVAAARHFTNDPRVLHRATWSARQGSRMLWGVRLAFLVPPGATSVGGSG